MQSSIPIYDVSIVGSGPAGSSAALKLAKNGLNVILIEKSSHPRYKTCGGGVVQRALKYLSIDVSDAIENNCYTVEFILNNSKQRYEYTSEKPIISMAMRDKFDKLLVSAAVAEGAELISDCEVIDVETNNKYANLKTSRGLFKAKYVITADGALSNAANIAGWKETRKLIPALECEVYVDDKTFESFSKSARFDFDLIPDGYAWVFPKKAHLSMGALRMNRKQTNLNEILQEYIRLLGINSFDKIEKHGYVIPVSPRKDTFMKKRILLVGDAAGLADPVTAEGISFAILSGQIAANSIIKGNMDESTVKRYFHMELNKKILSELKIARKLMNLVFMNTFIRTNLFRFYGHKLTKSMAQIFLGNETYKEIVKDPLNYLKLLRLWNPRNKY